jgi:hypothetical protein
VKDAIKRKQRFNNPFSSFMSSIVKTDNEEDKDWNALCSEMKNSFENGKMQEKEEEQAAMHGSESSEGRLSGLNKNLSNLFQIGSLDEKEEANTDWNALFTELNRHGKLPVDENEWHSLYKQAVESTLQTQNVKTPPYVREDEDGEDDKDDRDDEDDDVEHQMKFCLDLDGFMDRSTRSEHSYNMELMNRSTNSQLSFNVDEFMDQSIRSDQPPHQEDPCLDRSTRSESDLKWEQGRSDHSERSKKSWFGRKPPLIRDRPSEFSRRDLLPQLSERSLEVALKLM